MKESISKKTSEIISKINDLQIAEEKASCLLNDVVMRYFGKLITEEDAPMLVYSYKEYDIKTNLAFDCVIEMRFAINELEEMITQLRDLVKKE